MKRFFSFLIAFILTFSIIPGYAGLGGTSTDEGSSGSQKEEHTLSMNLNFLEAAGLASDGQFVFHNGCQFGDSYEVVTAKDPIHYGLSENKLYNQSAGVKDREYGNGEPGILAGIEKGEVIYYFIEDTLCEVQYSFGGFKDFQLYKSSYSTYYNKLRDALKEKYGQPLGNKGNKYYAITGEELTVSRAKAYSFVLDPLKYDEWVVDCGEYFVKIDLCAMLYDEDDTECYITLGFLPFTQNDLDSLNAADEAAKAKAAQAAQELQDALNKSLKDDL